MGSRVRRDATRTPAGSGLREEGTGVHVTATACEALSKLLPRHPRPLLAAQHEPGQLPVHHRRTHRARHCLQLRRTGRARRFRDRLPRLWGITVDTTPEADGKQKLIFRKAKAGEPLDAVRDDAPMVPPVACNTARATPHRDRRHRSADQVPTRDIKTVVREQLQTLEAPRQEKWDAIRAIWAGDGG